MTSKPLLSIWTRSRGTVRARLATDPTRYVLPWAVPAGIEQALARAGQHAPRPVAGGGADGHPDHRAAAGTFRVVDDVSLAARTGQRMSGTASPQELRTALAWASVPTVAALLTWVRRRGVRTGHPAGGPANLGLHAGLAVVFSLIDLALSLRGCVLLCITVAEVQGFRSAWVGLGNLMLATLILMVTGGLIALVVGLILVGVGWLHL